MCAPAPAGECCLARSGGFGLLGAAVCQAGLVLGALPPEGGLCCSRGARGVGGLFFSFLFGEDHQGTLLLWHMEAQWVSRLWSRLSLVSPQPRGEKGQSQSA